MQAPRPANSEIAITPTGTGELLIMVGDTACTCTVDAFTKFAHRVLCPPELSEEWFVTYTGIKFHPWAPTVDMVCIEDIAHHLSIQNRFYGATRSPYSTAQHSVLVSYLVPHEFAFRGLMHDGHEAYCGDVIRPVKRGLTDYRMLEQIHQKVVADKFGLPMEMPPEVKHADNVALMTERRDLINNPYQHEWFLDEQHFEPDKYRISPWPAHYAEQEFLGRFKELCP